MLSAITTDLNSTSVTIIVAVVAAILAVISLGEDMDGLQFGWYFAAPVGALALFIVMVDGMPLYKFIATGAQRGEISDSMLGAMFFLAIMATTASIATHAMIAVSDGGRVGGLSGSVWISLVASGIQIIAAILI